MSKYFTPEDIKEVLDELVNDPYDGAKDIDPFIEYISILKKEGLLGKDIIKVSDYQSRSPEGIKCRYKYLLPHNNPNKLYLYICLIYEDREYPFGNRLLTREVKLIGKQ